jgi:hypothetical protein
VRHEDVPENSYAADLAATEDTLGDLQSNSVCFFNIALIDISLSCDSFFLIIVRHSNTIQLPVNISSQGIIL